MKFCRSGWVMACFLMLLFINNKLYSQPTLPDITGNNEKGIVILSWVCQFDGVKSISVRRSADSLFNFSTIGYVKNVLKGTQAFADGRPFPGRNFYKLSIVFNSGLTWTSNHVGVEVDPATLNNRRALPNSEALQKLLITENTDKLPAKEAITAEKPVKKNNIPAKDINKYMEIVQKNDPTAPPPQPKLKRTETEENAPEAYLETLSVESRKKIKINYDVAPEDINAESYVEHTKSPTPKKKISITFDDKDDANLFMENMPKTPNRKITITLNDTTTAVNANKNTTALPSKKLVVTFKDEADAQAYLENIPENNKKKITLSYNMDTLPNVTTAVMEEKKEAPKPRIKLNFPDDNATNTSLEIKSKYIATDPISGHINMTLPDDYGTRQYSIRYFDKDNKGVIDIPRLNAQKIVLDKRNFQKKGQFKFTIRRDGIELESGYIFIY